MSLDRREHYTRAYFHYNATPKAISSPRPLPCSRSFLPISVQCFFFVFLFSRLSSDRTAGVRSRTPLAMIAYNAFAADTNNNVFDVCAFGWIPWLRGRRGVFTVWFFFPPSGPRDIRFFPEITTVANTNYLYERFTAAVQVWHGIISVFTTAPETPRLRTVFFFFFPRDSEVPTYGYKYVYTGKQIRIVNVENKACFERTANKYTFILIPKPTRRAPAPDPPPPADYGGTICLCYGLYRKPRVTNKSLLTSRALPSTV